MAQSKYGNRISATRLRVYELALEGLCQKNIRLAMNLGKGTISDQVNALIDDKYLILENPRGREKFYKKGPKGKILDELIDKESSGQNRGVRNTPTINPELSANPELSKETPNCEGIQLPPSCGVHSHGVRAHVVSKPMEFQLILIRGEVQEFLRKTKPIKGVDQWVGKITLPNGEIYSIRYNESPKTRWMYTWPDGIFTKEEIKSKNYEIELSNKAQEVFNFIAKFGGWNFGILESHKGSKTHFNPDSTLVDEISKIIPKGTKINGLWGDTSPPRPDGNITPETASPIVAEALLEDIVDMALDHQDIKQIIKTMYHDRRELINIVNALAVNQRIIQDDKSLILENTTQSAINQQAIIQVLKQFGLMPKIEVLEQPPGTEIEQKKEITQSYISMYG